MNWSHSQRNKGMARDYRGGNVWRSEGVSERKKMSGAIGVRLVSARKSATSTCSAPPYGGQQGLMAESKLAEHQR